MADKAIKKLIVFNEAFKPSVDDIARGDGFDYSSPTELKDFPEFGRHALIRKPINNLYDYLEAQNTAFNLVFKQEKASTDKVSAEDFQFVRKLGAGTYATVVMVKHKHSGIYYAKKAMPKHHIVMSKKLNEARNEKKVLEAIRFPFTVNLKFFYHDNVNIYFILPLLAGGELYLYLKKAKRIKERLARFIVSQLVLAMEYLHFIGIVHRDLKLENILIDHYGYIKVSDFGMCKLIYYKRTYTICGTAEYMAPEVIGNKGYGLAADWWSLGVLIFELCNGASPFYAEDTIQIFNFIYHCDYNMPVFFSPALKSLITNLLQVDLSKRLGNLKDGVNDVKKHTWFRDLPWMLVLNRKILSPMVPPLSDDKSFFKQQQEPAKITEESDMYASYFENF